MKKATIKFGKADRGWGYRAGDDVTFPILYKDKKGKWIEIGTMEAIYEEVGLGMRTNTASPSTLLNFGSRV